MQNDVPLVKQNVMELDVSNIGGQRIEEDKELIRRERRDGGEGEERGLREGAERGLRERAERG